jgi:nucleoside-diphosphate kinase
MSENASVVFVLVKPDAVMRGLVGRILTEFESRGFWINSLVMRFKSMEALKTLFEEIYNPAEWKEYHGKPLVGFILHCRQKGDAERIDKIVGISQYPESCEAGTIRERYGLNFIDNAIATFGIPSRIDAFYNTETDEDPRREA